MSSIGIKLACKSIKTLIMAFSVYLEIAAIDFQIQES